MNASRKNSMLVSAVAVMALAAGVNAGPLVGPGALVNELPQDRLFEDATVPPQPVTRYDGYLLSGQSPVVWKNVKLSDVCGFTAKMGGSGLGGAWQDAHVHNVKTNATSGAVTAQFQYSNGGFLYMVEVKFAQQGADVEATPLRCKYQWGKEYGFNFSTAGTDRTLTDTVSGDDVSITKIACIFEDGKEPLEPPSSLAFVNVDDSVPGGVSEVVGDAAYPKNEWVLALRDTDLSEVSELYAEIGGTEMGSQWVRAKADCYQAEDSDGDGACRWTQAQKYLSGRTALFGVVMKLRQVGADVYVKVMDARWAWGKQEGSVSFRTTGESVSYSTTVSGAQLALRNLSCTRTRGGVWKTAGTARGCMTTLNESYVVARKCRLADVSGFSALMGGVELGNDWRITHPERVTTNANGSVSVQFQYKYNAWLLSVLVEFAQTGDDIVGVPKHCKFSYNSPYGTDMTKIGGEKNLADGVSGADVSICDVSVLFENRVPHVATIADSYDMASLPVTLKNVDLDFDVGISRRICKGEVGGLGAFVKSGTGELVLVADKVTARDGIRVNGGRLIVANDVSVYGGVSVSANAALAFDVGEGGVPVVVADALTLAAGSTLVFTAMTAESAPLEDTVLVRGCGLTAAGIEGVVVQTEGALANYKAKLTVGANGDLQVRFSERKGLMLIFR